MISDVSLVFHKLPLLGEADEQRRQMICAKFVEGYRAQQQQVSLIRRFFRKVRAIFLFLLASAIATFILAHVNEINSLAAEKAAQLEQHLKKQDRNNPLRQKALNYEHQVDDAGASHPATPPAM